VSTITSTIILTYYIALSLREIRQYQQTTELIFPKKSFTRIVREILLIYTKKDSSYRIQSAALEALQEAAEAYIVSQFEGKISAVM